MNSSWVYGDGCFDMTRTFGHRLFKVKEHVDRLYRSLKYLRIDPGFGPDKMCELTEELFERDRHLLGPDDDYWVGQRISRGVKEAPGDNIDYHGPNVVLECNPLPLPARQAVQGRHQGHDPVAPPHAAGFAHAARQDAQLPQPHRRRSGSAEHRSGSLGGVCSTSTATSAKGWAPTSSSCARRIVTPREKFVLPGVSRQTAIDLAREEGLSLREADIDLYDAYNADEIFLTSTSLCICPVTKVNGVAIGRGPGVGAGDAAHRRRLPALREPRLRRAVHEVLRRGRGDAAF